MQERSCGEGRLEEGVLRTDKKVIHAENMNSSWGRGREEACG